MIDDGLFKSVAMYYIEVSMKDKCIRWVLSTKTLFRGETVQREKVVMRSNRTSTSYIIIHFLYQRKIRRSWSKKTSSENFSGNQFPSLTDITSFVAP